MTIWKVETMRMYFRRGAASTTPGLPGRPEDGEKKRLTAAAPARVAGVLAEEPSTGRGEEGASSIDDTLVAAVDPDMGPLKMAESSA